MYRLYAFLTAPGVIIHEFGHIFFCFVGGVHIRSVRLFSFKKIAGFVVHDEPTNWYQALCISYGPLLVNSLLAMMCFSRLRLPPDPLSAVMFWLGFAIGLHAIPSSGDARSLLLTTNHLIKRNPLAVITYPFVGILMFLNLLRRVHADVVFTVFLLWLGAYFLKA